MQAWITHTGKLNPTQPVPPTKQGTITRTYEGHTGRVNALAWSADSRSIASASDDRTVQVWKSGSGQMLALYDGHSHSRKRWQTNHVNTVVWSPVRDMLASSGDDGVIRIWRAEPEPHTLLTYDKHKGKVESIGWSPDGKLLASVSQDTLHLWNPDTGKTLARFDGYSGTIYCLDWSPDNTQLVLGHENGSLEIVNVVAQNTMLERQKVYTGHRGKITNVRWSPDGTRIASTGTGEGIQIWEAASNRCLLEYTRNHSPVHALDWSPDSHAIVSAGGDGRIQIWNVQNKQHIYTHPSYNTMVRAIAWSPDGLYIAFGAHSKVHVWWVGSSTGVVR